MAVGPLLPGMGAPDSVAALPASNPMLPSELAEAAALSHIDDAAGGYQMYATMYGKINDAHTKAVVDAINGLRDDFRIRSGEPTTGGTWAPQKMPEASKGPEARPQTLTNVYDAAADKFVKGKEAGLSGIGQAVRSRVAETVQRVATPLQTEVDAHGEEWYTDSTGFRAPASSSEGQKMLRRSVRNNAMITGAEKIMGSAGLGAHVEAGGVMGALGAIGKFGGKVAGPIGMAVGAANSIAQASEAMIEGGAEYRSAFGRDETGLLALEDRAGEWWNGIQGIGTIGMGRGREQYKQASALGLRGNRRDEAIDFATDMYMNLGLDTAESMSIVQKATKNTNLSLEAFAKGMEEVTAAAVQAGKSARSAREDFLATQGVLQGSSLGSGTVAASQALTEVATNLNLGEGGGALLAGAINDQTIAYAANVSGQNIDTLLANRDSGEGLENIVGTLATQATNAVFNAWGFANPQEGRAKFREITKSLRNGDEGKPPVDLWNDILAAFQPPLSPRGFEVFGSPMYGLQGLSRPQQIEVFLGNVWDQMSPLNAPSQTGPGTSPGPGESGGGAGYGYIQEQKPYGTERSGKYAMAGAPEEVLRTQVLDELSGRNRLKMGAEPGVPESWKNTDSEVAGLKDALSEGYGVAADETANAFADFVYRTGIKDTSAEAIFKGREALTDKAGVNALDDVKIKVKDGDGKDIEVPIKEIFSNDSYRQQFSQGLATVNGQSATSLIGVAATPPSAQQQNFTPPLLDLTPEAKRLLIPLGPTDAQRNGVPPSSSGPVQYPRSGANR